MPSSCWGRSLSMRGWTQAFLASTAYALEVLRQLLLWESQTGCSRGTEDGVAKWPGTIMLKSLLTRFFLCHSLCCNNELFVTFTRLYLFDHCMLGTLNLCMSTVCLEHWTCAWAHFSWDLFSSQRSALCSCMVWLGMATSCVREVVFRWLRYERSKNRFSHTHLGVWVLVCRGYRSHGSRDCSLFLLPFTIAWPPTHPHF